MKVKCINNKVSFLPKDILDNYRISYDEFRLKIGKEYVVYALRIYLGYIWYCICEERNNNCPMWNPSVLFELTDNRLSRYWIFSFDEENNKKTPYLSIPEWDNNPYFYSNLIDGNEEEVNTFKHYKERMDLEFPDSSVFEIAGTGDQEWLICPFCIDAWQHPSDEDALVRCPKCRNILNNPRYKNIWPHL